MLIKAQYSFDDFSKSSPNTMRFDSPAVRGPGQVKCGKMCRKTTPKRSACSERAASR